MCCLVVGGKSGGSGVVSGGVLLWSLLLCHFLGGRRGSWFEDFSVE